MRAIEKATEVIKAYANHWHEPPKMTIGTSTDVIFGGFSITPRITLNHLHSFHPMPTIVPQRRSLLITEQHLPFLLTTLLMYIWVGQKQITVHLAHKITLRPLLLRHPSRPWHLPWGRYTLGADITRFCHLRHPLHLHSSYQLYHSNAPFGSVS